MPGGSGAGFNLEIDNNSESSPSKKLSRMDSGKTNLNYIFSFFH